MFRSSKAGPRNHRQRRFPAYQRILYARTRDIMQKLQATRREPTLEPAFVKLNECNLFIPDDFAQAQIIMSR
jgi:DNA replication protein DnaC